MSELRLRLIEELCRLPEEHLASVHRLLSSLDLPPFVGPSQSESSTRLKQIGDNKDWSHAPLNRLSQHGTYVVTASTTPKEHFFRGEDRLTLLENKLLCLAKQFDLTLEAWAVFSNHYHFVVQTSGVENQLGKMIERLHYDTAEQINHRDGAPGRAIWFNFWETRLTFERSYFARLNYVHQNAVKHGLVGDARNYPWCSAAWFENVATPAQWKTILGFRIDRVKIDDDYEPVL
jgi:putative transposase